MRISYRHADLLDLINPPLEPDPIEGYMLLEFMQGEIHWVETVAPAKYRTEIVNKIWAAMDEAGFEMNVRSDGNFDPYYTLDEDPQAPTDRGVLDSLIEFMEAMGFEASYEGPNPRILIRFKYYPLVKTADLLDHLNPVRCKLVVYTAIDGIYYYDIEPEGTAYDKIKPLQDLIDDWISDRGDAEKVAVGWVIRDKQDQTWQDLMKFLSANPSVGKSVAQSRQSDSRALDIKFEYRP